MTSFISEELIEEISNRLDIVEIISQYLPLKRAGKNYKALCPFHEEKTPSFIVSPEKQLFHCFGCGVGGNVFNFLMKWEKITFPEAVKIVAERTGVSIPALDKEKGKGVIKEKLYRTNELVAKLFQEELEKNRTACNYLKRRGFTREIIEKFGLGYAPSSDKFLKLVEQKGLSLKDLKQLNLLTISQKEKGWYAWFRFRLIFPIFNAEGKICGFAGRVLDNSLPKYINSPQSLIFDKSQILYGLNFSKEVIREKEEIILVEGYTDVMALYRAGIKNVVASMGTSLTPRQGRLIKRYADRVFVAYDQDKAGITATLRSIDLLLEADLDVKIINMPQGMDPEELIKEKGKNFFIMRKKKATPYFDYRLDMAINNRSSLEGKDKVKIVNILFSTLEKIKNSIRLAEFIKKLSQRLDLEEGLLRAEFNKFRQGKRGFFARPEFLEIKNRQVEAEKTLLQLMLSEKAIIRMVEKSECINDFINSSYRKVAEEIINSSKEGEVSSLKLINKLREEELSSLVSSLSLSEEFPLKEDKHRIASDLIGYLQKNNKQRKIQREIDKLRKNSKEEETDEMLSEIVKLKKQIITR